MNVDHLDCWPEFSQEDPMTVAIFMSGSGSNAKKIIEAYIADRDAGLALFKPALIFTDNPKSNAERIATKDYADKGVVVPFVCNDIHKFGASKSSRERFDIEQVKCLDDFGVAMVALAGYDWTVTPALCNSLLTVNVHPGDLRASDNGKRPYVGLGWIPSAKAVLAGEKYVHSSVHVVTSELDAGPLLAVSAGVPVGLSLEERAVCLGSAKNLTEVRHAVKDSKLSDEMLAESFPIYGIAKALQEQLKVKGDWVIFPRVVRDLASGKFSYANGIIHYEGMPIPNGLEVLK